MIVDTHAHLCAKEFNRDLDQVLERAAAAGVKSVICVSEGLEEARKNLDLARKHPMIRPAAGLFPTVLDKDQALAARAFIKENKDELVAIGEVGLDRWAVKGEADREVQRDIFAWFIRISNDSGLPLNVHSRSAGKRAVDLLLERNAKKVQLHAFDGKWSAAQRAVEAGYFFSIPPSITRSRQKQKLAARLPLSNLLLETDSPVLGPDVNLRNEPENILVSARAIAKIKEIPVEAVLEAAKENVVKLYGPSILE